MHPHTLDSVDGGEGRQVPADATGGRNVVAFRLPEDEGADLTRRGHGFMAVERLKVLLEQLDGDDRAYVVDLVHGMLAEFVVCPDGCHER